MLELLAINIIISFLIVPLLAPLVGFNNRLAIPANDCTYKRLKKHQLHMLQTEPLREKVAEDELLFIEQSAWLADCRRRRTARDDAGLNQRPANFCDMPAAFDSQITKVSESAPWPDSELPLAG